MLLSTHVMQEVEATCSRLLILNRGRLVAEGSVEELLTRRAGAVRYVAELEGEGVVSALSGLPGVRDARSEEVDGRVRVYLESSDEEELRPKIFSIAKERDWTLWELHRERVSLEQVFRDLTREADGRDRAAAPDEEAGETPASAASADEPSTLSKEAVP